MAGVRPWHAVESVGLTTESVLFDETSDRKIAICAGTLDSPTGLREKAHIFSGCKGDYYEISGDLPSYDTLP